MKAMTMIITGNSISTVHWNIICLAARGRKNTALNFLAGIKAANGVLTLTRRKRNMTGFAGAWAARPWENSLALITDSASP